MIVKTTGQMRAFLLQQMEQVAKGAQETGQAKAICNYSQQIYNFTAIREQIEND